MKTFKIAVFRGVIASPGNKPDFGKPGQPREELTPAQRRARTELTYRGINLELTACQIASEVDAGHTLTAQHKPSRKNSAYDAAQHAGLDFDNLNTTDDVFKHPIVQQYGAIIYHTPSSKPGKPKMRVIFLLDEPIYDPLFYKKLMLAMMFLFEGNADPACKDLCRLFYGNKGCEPTVTDKVLPVAVARQWVEQWEAAGQPGMKRRPNSSTTTPQADPGEYQTGKSQRDDSKPSTPYGKAALKNWVDVLVQVNIAGQYYMPLNAGAFHLGRLVHGAELNIKDVRAKLEWATVGWPYSWQSDLSLVVEKAISDASSYPRSAPPRTQHSDNPYPFETDIRSKASLIINSKFMPDLPKQTKKVRLIMARKGGGKTEMLARLVATMAPEKFVLLIEHRIALTMELAERLGLKTYMDFFDEEFSSNPWDRHGMSDCERLAICIDSVTKLFGNEDDRYSVLIDEVEQVLRHLLSSTVKKNGRAEIFGRFLATLEATEFITCCDADLSMVSYNFFARLFGEENIEVIINDYKRPGMPPISRYEERTDLDTVLYDYLAKGNRAYVSSNSQKWAVDLTEIIKAKFPSLKVLCITSDNSADPEIQKKLKDFKAYASGFDVVITSPSLNTGVNLDSPDFPETFVYGYHGSTTHYDLSQHTLRNRQANKIHAYIAPGNRFEPTSPEYWKTQCIKKAEETGIAVDAITSAQLGERVAATGEGSYIALWSDITAVTAHSHNALAENFYYQAEQEGHKIIDAGAATTPEAKAEAKTLRKSAKQDRKSKRVEAIAQAKPLSKTEYEKLKDKAYKTPSERAACERYRIEDFYGQEATQELIELDKEGSFMRTLDNFMLATGSADPVERDKAAFSKDKDYLPHLPHAEKARATRDALLIKSGLTGVDKEIDETSLKKCGFVSHYLTAEAKEEVFKWLRLRVKGDFQEKPVELIARVLEQIGIELACYRKGKRGNQTRIYKISEKSVKAMQQLTEARLKHLEDLRTESAGVAAMFRQKQAS